MSKDPPSVDLSVVVAAERPGNSLEKCLSGLTAQLSPVGGEVLVVVGSGGNAADRLEKEFPSVRFLRPKIQNEVPRLWSAGIAAARGRLVALTIDQCMPGPGWARQVLRAHDAEWPAIGGAIEMAPGLSLVDQAIYLCRYSRYTPPFPAEFQDDLAGDNSSYKRAALDRVGLPMSEGFWETFVHQEMRRQGQRLLADPSIVVYYVGSYSWLGFLKRRFLQARYFGSRRAVELAPSARFLRCAAFPAISLLMLARIAAHVWARRRHRLKFLVCTPLVFSFLLAWAAGEGLGYLRGPAKRADAANAGRPELLDEVR